MKSVLLALSGNHRVKDAALRFPPARAVVGRFVPGESVDQALAAVRGLADRGLAASVDHLGENTFDAATAEGYTRTYLTLLDRLAADDLASTTEVSIKASALGQNLSDDLALTNAQRICAAAAAAGTTVTVDMEDHTTTDATLRLVDTLRADFPTTGCVLQAMLHRTEADCDRLATPGSRVRLCKGAYDEPATVAARRGSDINAAYLRCLRALLKGEGYPMIATHDPAMIATALDYIDLAGREPSSYEFQMLFGIRPDEQERLAAAGHRVRVYVPFGTDWYAYFLRRLAEKPANLALLVRALGSRR